jgi:hypothetical protein
MSVTIFAPCGVVCKNGSTGFTKVKHLSANLHHVRFDFMSIFFALEAQTCGHFFVLQLLIKLVDLSRTDESDFDVDDILPNKPSRSFP